jgi:hypothetical protein
MKLSQRFKRILAMPALAVIIASLLACADSAPGNRNQNTSAAARAANLNRSTPAQPAASKESGDSSPDDFEGTAGIVEKRRDDVEPALLRDVRTARHDGFDRVVFEFEGSNIPGYHVEYVDRPVRQCGSGEPVPVAGDAWLLVRTTPANAHTDAGQPTVKERERNLDLPNLKELELICDFEAEVSWVLGLASPNRYRVLELSNPPRLVVDVKQNRR